MRKELSWELWLRVRSREGTKWGRKRSRWLNARSSVNIKNGRTQNVCINSWKNRRSGDFTVNRWVRFCGAELLKPTGMICSHEIQEKQHRRSLIIWSMCSRYHYHHRKICRAPVPMLTNRRLKSWAKKSMSVAFGRRLHHFNPTGVEKPKPEDYVKSWQIRGHYGNDAQARWLQESTGDKWFHLR